MTSDYRRWPARFREKVDVKETNDCWLWNAVCIPNGYGQFWLNGRMVNAHRAAIILGGGSIDPDQVVLHSCDERRCCNPKHLCASSQAANMQDMVSKGRSLRGIRHSKVKLREEDVIQIRKSTLTAAQEAARCGVSRATINDIRQGLSWRHLTRG